MCNLFLNVLNYINTILFYLETVCLYPSYYTMPFKNVHFSTVVASGMVAMSSLEIKSI